MRTPARALVALVAAILLDGAPALAGHVSLPGPITSVDRSSSVAGATNQVGGSSANTIDPGAYAAAIAGGGTAYVGGTCTINGTSCKNEISNAGSNYSFIGGGVDNVIATDQASQASTIGGGGHNLVNQADGHGTIAGGSTNSCTGGAGIGYCAIGGGSTNSVAGNLSGVAGGFTNSVGAGADYSSILGGNSNAIGANADYACILGGLSGSLTKTFACGYGREFAARYYGGFTQASRKFSTVGDAQTSVVTMLKQTTDATADVELFLDGSAGAERIVLPSGSSFAVRATIIGRRASSGFESKMWSCDGLIHNNGGTTAMAAAITPTAIANDANASTWTIKCQASDAVDAFQILVTGENSKTVNWVARVELTEVGG